MTRLAAALLVLSGLLGLSCTAGPGSPPDPLERAASLDELAAQLYFAPDATAKDREKAESLLRDALEIRRATLGDSDPAVAETLSDLSTLAYVSGLWRQAEELERQALEVFRERLGEKDPRVAQSLRGLGAILYRQGRFAEAASHLETAFAILEQADPQDPSAKADALNAIAEVFRAQGRYPEAEERFLQARGLVQTGDPFLAEILSNLAGLYRDQSRLEEAEPLLARSLEIWENDPETGPDDLARAYVNQADIYRLQGRYEDAAALAARGLELARQIFDPEHPELAWFPDQVGLIYTEIGRYPEAEAAYGEALALLERSAPDHPLTAQVLNDLGRLLRETGRYEEAEKHYLRALDIRRRVFGPDHPETAVTLTQLARSLFLRGGRDGRAAEIVGSALSTFDRTSAYPEMEVEARALNAEILKRGGNTSGALEAMAAALIGVEELRPHTGGGEATRAGFLGRYVGHFNKMVSWLIEAGRPAEALQYAERVRARVLLDQLAAGRVDLRRGIPSEVLEPLERRQSSLAALLAELQQRLAALRSSPDAAGESPKELEARLDLTGREYQQVVNEIRNASPLWKEIITSGGRPVSADALQREVVPSGGLLLLYQVGPDASFLFTVPPLPGEIRSWPLEILPDSAQALGVDPGSLTSKTLDEILSGDEDSAGLAPLLGVTRGLKRESPSLPEEVLSRRLHAFWRVLVPGDLWPLIRQAPEVVLVPDGGLHLLPFEALVVEPGTYWIDDGPVIRYAPSATTLYNLTSRERIGGDGGLLLVSDPAFGGEPAAGAAPSRSRYLRAGGSLARLPGTAREAEAIRGALPVPITALAGQDAEESKVRAALGNQPRYIHFATHGLVDQERNEILAALALAPPLGGISNSDNDGLLQLFEIYELDLDSDLVVLSACETQIGRRLAGEGVFALSRGFLAAGSLQVVASLWPVNDESTALLMGDFYQRIGTGKGVDPARALRDARLALRNKQEWSAPYFWAPFILSGAAIEP